MTEENKNKGMKLPRLFPGTKLDFLKPKDTISSILGWFKISVPEPTEHNRDVQLGCCIEEFTELLQAYSANGMVATNALKDAIAILKFVKNEAYKGKFYLADKPARIAALDAICDIYVTGVGLSYYENFRIEGALSEVDRSNYSKLTNGKAVFDKNGKIAKPPTYSPPKLDDFV